MCAKHNDPLKVYCETCHKVICRDCTISQEHNKHKFELISECYHKYQRQIKDDLNLLKDKAAVINTTVTVLISREREVVQQGEEIEEQIHTHAQQLIDRVQKSERRLMQQVNTVVQQKRDLLTKQREQAEGIYTQIKICEEMIEESLKEFSQQQVMLKKEEMLEQMNTATKLAEATKFHQIEAADIQFLRVRAVENGIGSISSTFREGQSAPTSVASEPFSIDMKQEGKQKVGHAPLGKGDELRMQSGADKSGSPLTYPMMSSSGEPVTKFDGLNQPWGLAVCDNGNTVVVEHGANCVTIIDKKGRKLKSFGTKGRREGQFMHPRGVAISNDGHILVTDEHRLQKLTFDGVCVKSVGSGKIGRGEKQFCFPIGIAVCSMTGHVFVADSENNRIHVFHNNLKFSRIIALYGEKQLCSPYDVALDSEGYLYVAEYGDQCITKLTNKGQYVMSFGTGRNTRGLQCSMTSLTINNSLLYATDRTNRVSIFDTRGNFLYDFGNTEKERVLSYPHGITNDEFCNLYVSDTHNNRIIKF